MIKRFLEWIYLKEKLHNNSPQAPFVNEGDIWWVSIGDNIGSEINGKSQKFSRPAVVLKKYSNQFFLMAPTTSKDKCGSWYIAFKQKGKAMNVCLHQTRSMDYRRFYSKLGELDKEDFNRVKKGFYKLHGL